MVMVLMVWFFPEDSQKVHIFLLTEHGGILFKDVTRRL